MRKLFGFPTLAFLICLQMPFIDSASATIYWVGDSPACDPLNARDTLDLAVLAAGLTADNDEIRLTNTVSHNGIFGDANFTDFKPGVKGSLEVVGGYSDCGSGKSGRSLVESTAGDTFLINTANESTSIVTFKNIEIKTSGGRAIHATGNVEVTLENVWIHHNRSGVSAWSGAFIDMKASTIIEDNGTATDWGGGIYCTGANSQVNVSGRLARNISASGNGGNIFLSNGCFVELVGGAIIEGPPGAAPAWTQNGAGIYVDSGGELLSNGGASRVTIQNLNAIDGAGLYIKGTGRAILRNTVFRGNNAKTGNGSAIYAIDGGTSEAQVVMDRVAPCPFTFSCSEFEDNYVTEGLSLIYVSNSLVDIHRSVMERTIGPSSAEGISALVTVVNNGEARLNAINMTRNNIEQLLYTFNGKIIMTQSTIADNSGDFTEGTMDSFIGFNVGTMDFQNSIMVDTQGVDNNFGDTVIGKCNMVDVPRHMPANSYFIDTPVFINKAGADYRQHSSSPGVDMCNNDNFAFSSPLDLGYQTRPINDGLNPSGMPGEAGGKYDGGYWETSTNPAPDFVDLNVTLAGSGSGHVISTNVTGIGCEADCFETYDQGIFVTLLATPAPGNTVTWSGCNIPSGNQCAVTMDTNRSITATFHLPSDEDLIFADSLED